MKRCILEWYSITIFGFVCDVFNPLGCCVVLHPKWLRMQTCQTAIFENVPRKVIGRPVFVDRNWAFQSRQYESVYSSGVVGAHLQIVIYIYELLTLSQISKTNVFILYFLAFVIEEELASVLLEIEHKEEFIMFYYFEYHTSGLAYRNTIFSGPMHIQLLFLIQTFLSPHAILSSSTFIMFFLLRHLISHLFASLLNRIKACCLETERQGNSRSTWWFLALSPFFTCFFSLLPMKKVVLVMYCSQFEALKTAQPNQGKWLMCIGTGSFLFFTAGLFNSCFSSISLPKICPSLLSKSYIFQLTFLPFSSQHLKSGPTQVITSVDSSFSIKPRLVRILRLSWTKFLVLRSFCCIMKASTISSTLLLLTVYFSQMSLQKMLARRLPPKIQLFTLVDLPSTSSQIKSGLPPQQH